MSTVTLYPPLHQIEQQLFAIPDDLIVRLAENDASVPTHIREAVLADEQGRELIENMRQALIEEATYDVDSADSIEPPAFIKALISQKEAASQTDFGVFPDVGQMIQITQLPTPSGVIADLQIGSSLTVLLSHQDKDSKVWHGWMMAPEIQYAGFWDMLLEETDEPFDPACGMVQIWNPVQLYFPAHFKTKVLGRLTAARMVAVRALAAEFLFGDPIIPRSRPGFIAARATMDNFAVVTGSPLGDKADPRHGYQQCYHHVAQLINAPVLAWQTAAEDIGADILNILRDRLAAVWQDITGLAVQPLAPVAHAMHVQEQASQVLIALADDLRLNLAQVDDGIDLTLTYLGANQVKVTIIDNGEQAKTATLSPSHKQIDYPGLNILADNRLLIDLPDGKHVELPVSTPN